nr:MAG TPA: hypothetical protein [Caudoviricetes sp.]DAW09298.1 MAG TPA: hypothetical protein [Caudoviricetes sp.]
MRVDKLSFFVILNIEHSMKGVPTWLQLKFQ